MRILNQGTAAFDVSEVSPDHGVAVEPLFARDIEVVRGLAFLLYGITAIGGVVNVIGSNLGIEEARPHASYLKDLAPMSGRNLEVGIRSRW